MKIIEELEVLNVKKELQNDIKKILVQNKRLVPRSDRDDKVVLDSEQTIRAAYPYAE